MPPMPPWPSAPPAPPLVIQIVTDPFFIGGVSFLLISLFGGGFAYYVHVRNPRWVESHERCKSFVNWICVENLLELMTEVANLLAATSENPFMPFVVSFALNIIMIVMERIEYQMDKKIQGNEPSRWHVFMFGRWKSTSKLFWGKRTARIALLFQFCMNLTCVACFISFSLVPEGASEGDFVSVLSIQNQVKNFHGLLTIVEALFAPTLLDPLLEQCGCDGDDCKSSALANVRISIFASSRDKAYHYRAKDFVLSNLSILIGTYVYMSVTFRDAACRNRDDRPGTSPWGPEYADSDREHCLKFVSANLWDFDKFDSLGEYIGSGVGTLFTVVCILVVLCLAKKLSPKAEELFANENQPCDPPQTKAKYLKDKAKDCAQENVEYHVKGFLGQLCYPRSSAKGLAPSLARV